MKPRPISEQIYKKLLRVIPGGVNSPVRTCAAVGDMPMVVASGSGDLIYDPDGHSYIDYCGSWGSLIHGHAHPEITKAVQKRVALGTSFGITSAIEEEIARKVTTLMPSIEKVRFVSSGTEATMSAARLARGYTGREIIIKFDGNYHGHADFFLIRAGSGVFSLNESSSAGIPNDIVKNTISLRYNDIEECRAVFNKPELRDRIAAVILEPIAGNMGVVPASQAFLKMLREETQKAGALLIFDEVISGFRVGINGAQGLYGIEPDLTCLAKIVGGGFPAAAFGGRNDIMEKLAPMGPVYQAGTLSGNPIAMEAGLQALNLLDRPGFYEALQMKTDIIVKPVQKEMQSQGMNACIQSVGSMFTPFFGCKKVRDMDDARGLDFKKYAQFWNFLFSRGIYCPPAQQEAWFVSAAHTKAHLEYTRDVILEFMRT